MRKLLLASLLTILLAPAALVAISTARADGVTAYCVKNSFCYLIDGDNKCYLSGRAFDSAAQTMRIRSIPHGCRILNNKDLDELISRIDNIVILESASIQKWMDAKASARHEDKSGHTEVHVGVEGGNGSEPSRSSVTGSVSGSYERDKHGNEDRSVEGEIRIKLR